MAVGSPCSAPLPSTTPPGGPAGLPPRSASLLRRVCRRLPGQDEARQRGAGAERGLKGASELLCGVWLPSGRREAPPERSGKLLTNVGPACSAGRRSGQRQHGRPLATQGRDPRPRHAPDPAPTGGIKCRPSAFRTLADGGGPGWHSPPWHISNHFPQPSSPLRRAALCASVSPVRMGCTAAVGTPGWAELPVGCRGLPGSSRPGQEPHLHRWPGTNTYLSPSGCSPGAGCVEPGVPLPGSAGTPCASTPGHPAPPCALHRRSRPPRDTLGCRFKGWEADMIPPER